MSDPSLALQKAVRERLVASAAVTALLPADSIFDRHARPERFPCIVLGEGQVLFARPGDPVAYRFNETAAFALRKIRRAAGPLVDTGGVRASMRPQHLRCGRCDTRSKPSISSGVAE